MQDINTTFTNPYEGLKKTEHCLRYSVHLSRSDLSFLRQLDTQHGSLSTAVAILVTRLINELKRNGITQYDPPRFRNAVGGLKITFDGAGTDDPRRARSAPSLCNAHESNSGDVGRGTGSVPCSTSTTPLVNASVASPPKRKRRTNIKAVAVEGEGVGVKE